MPYTDDQYKAQLIADLGGSTKLDPLIAEAQWSRFSSITNAELRYQYATIGAINTLLGSTWQAFETRTASGEVMKADEPFLHLLELAKRADAQIKLLTGDVPPPLAADGSNAAPSMGEMEARTPLETPAGYYPDPNSPHYTGDPLWRVR